jgi:hypothetical protein
MRKFLYFAVLLLCLVYNAAAFSPVICNELAGGATIICTNCTTDGDGSTALLVCEDFNASGSNCSGDSDASFDYDADSSTCAESGYASRQKYDTSVTNAFTVAAQTDFTTLIIITTPAVFPDDAYIFNTRDTVANRNAWLLTSSTDGDFQLYWNDNGGTARSHEVSGTSVSTTYVIEVGFQNNDATTGSGNGIDFYFYALGSARSEETLTNDSTWDVTNGGAGGAAGVVAINLRNHLSVDADNQEYKIRAFKVRTSTSYPPDTCK